MMWGILLQETCQNQSWVASGGSLYSFRLHTLSELLYLRGCTRSSEALEARVLNCVEVHSRWEANGEKKHVSCPVDSVQKMKKDYQCRGAAVGLVLIHPELSGASQEEWQEEGNLVWQNQHTIVVKNK